MALIKTVQKVAAPISRRVRLMIGRAVLALVNDASRVQGLQVTLLAGETRDEVERFQEYGFTSHPHPGAEAVLVAVGGSRDHGIVIAVEDRRYRLRGLAQGEVALYSDEGDAVVLKRGRLVEVTTATLKITASAGVEMLTPLLQITGGDVRADAISLKTHVHGGVEAGSADTSVPHP
jgi:phage baseplate assembly protein V